jgi:hypothetical protein
MKKILLFGMLFLLMLSVAFALPPTERLAGGLTIETLSPETHYANTDFFLHSHVYDTETGVIVNNTDLECFYHLYSENINWEHLDIGELSPVGVGMSKTLNASLFNETGEYAILLWCDQPVPPSEKEGGFVKFFFNVVNENSNNNNNVVGIDLSLLTLIVLILAIVLAIAINNGVIGIVASIGVLAQGLYYVLDSVLLGVITIVIGLILALYFATKQAD